MIENDISFFMSGRKNCLCGGELKYSFFHSSSDREDDFWFIPRQSFRFDDGKLIFPYSMKASSGSESFDFDIIVDGNKNYCDIVSESYRDLIASQFHPKIQRQLNVVVYRSCPLDKCNFHMSIHTLPLLFHFFWSGGIVKGGIANEVFSITDGDTKYIIDNDFRLKKSRIHVSTERGFSKKEIFSMDLEQFLSIPFDEDTLRKKIKTLAVFY